MDVHEYQAKELLASFGVAVPKGAIAFSPDQAVYAATELGGSFWAVKAQIHAGGRGKAGGVKLAKNSTEAHDAAAKILGIDERAGSIEKGKEANLVISEGDILDMRTSIVTRAFIQGREIDLADKHKQLTERYRYKYGLQ